MISQSGSSHGAVSRPIFTLFNQLPPELRFQVWEIAIPSSRIININERLAMRPNLGGLSLKDTRDQKIALEPNDIAPSTLFACRESRQVAQKCYATSLDSVDSITETYLDFHINTLYIRFNTFAQVDIQNWFQNLIRQLELIYQSDNFDRVRRLAILVDSAGNGDCDLQLSQVLSWFYTFQELAVDVKYFNRGSDDRGYIVLIEPADAIKTSQIYETDSAGTSHCSEIQDTLLGITFVFAMELERNLVLRHERSAIKT
jgi:hypothetical protein